MTASQDLTTRQRDALVEIVRRGGGLAGGRENTKVQNALVNKGYVKVVADLRRYVATKAGEELVFRNGWL